MTQLQPAKSRFQRPTLSIVNPQRAVPIAVSGIPGALEQWQAMSTLIQKTGARLDSSAFTSATQRTETDSACLTLHTTFTSADEFSTYQIRGLRGIIAAEHSSLSVTLVGVAPNASPGALASVLSKTVSRIEAPVIGIDASLHSARAFSDKLNREARYTAKLVSCEEMKNGNGNLLLVAANQVDELAQYFAQLSGTDALLVKRTSSQAGTRVRWIPMFKHEQAKIDPSGLVLSVVELLACIGQHKAAKQLHNAWLVTLEAGFHTNALNHIAPYTHQVSANEFIKEIMLRLGEQPKRLQQEQKQPVRPALQLVG